MATKGVETLDNSFYEWLKKIQEAQEKAEKMLRNPSVQNAINQIQEAQEKAEKMLRNPSVQNAINQVFKTNLYLSQAFSKKFAVTDKTIQTLLPSVNIALQTLNRLNQSEIFEIFKRKIVKELTDHKEIVINALQKYNWFICPSLPLNDLRNEIIINKAQGRQISNFLVNYYTRQDYQLIKLMLKNWDLNPYVKKRLFIIEQAVNSFKAGDNYAAICTLLPQIEGIAGNYVSNNRHFLDKENKSKHATVRALREGVKQNIKTDSLIAFIENIAFYNLKPTEEPKRSLNRNSILHGRGLRYGNKPNFLKCFLLIDALSWLEDVKL